MTAERPTGSWVVWTSLLLAFLASSFPLPGGLDRFRPDWMALVLIYWCLTMPHRFGMGFGWLIGLLVDVGRGALLGQHALAFVAVAYLILQVHRRLRLFSVWRQSLSVLVLLLVEQLLVFWISGVIGYPPRDGWYLAPAVGGMAAWPLLVVVLRDAQHSFQVR